MSSSVPAPEMREVSVNADLFMGFEDHQELRKQIVACAWDLAHQRTPDAFNTQLHGIPLQGKAPMGFPSGYAGPFSRMDFLAKKSATTLGDSAVNIWLTGSKNRKEQLQIFSEQGDVEFGRNKQFHVQPYREQQPAGHLSCGDLGHLLDYIIPDTGRFSALSDPRKDPTFDQIAYAMGDLLRPKAASEKMSLTYIAKEFPVSSIGTVDYLGVIGTMLIVKLEKGTPSYHLKTLVPIDIDAGRVLESFDYSFTLHTPPKTPEKGKIEVAPPMHSEAKVTLGSLDLPKATLDAYVLDKQQSLNAMHIGEHAISSLLSDLPRTS